MRSLFADTFYRVALLNPGDAFHARVTAFGNTLGSARIVTTDEVLTEVLNWFCQWGPRWRGEAAALIHDLRADPTWMFSHRLGLLSMPRSRCTKPVPTRVTAWSTVGRC